MNPFISPAEQFAHSRALITLQEADVPVLVGGAYAMFHYTGLVRYTKDLDLFLRKEDEEDARAALAAAGYRTDALDPSWISKAYWGDIFIDLIFSSGNGIAIVDDDWIRYAPVGETLGVVTRIAPPEEMIWSKGFVQERERWDGADVSHLLRACGRDFDWPRLLRRFDPHWQVLLAHLTLFSYSYPQDRGVVPRWVWRELLDRAEEQQAEPATPEKICRGTLLSRTQYAPDIGLWGYRDARELEVPGFEAVDNEAVCANFSVTKREEPLPSIVAASEF
jgi:hypothetical protein